jgi:mono/diheme cytochrome c family protein
MTLSFCKPVPNRLKPAPSAEKKFSFYCFNFRTPVVVLPTLCEKGKLIFKSIPVSESTKPMFRKLASALAFIIAFLAYSPAFAQPDGKALFQANCASCHNPIKDATGPALQGVDSRTPGGMEWIHEWVHGPAAKIASGDKYANEIYTKWNKTQMTAFPNLKNEEIDAIVKYVNEYKAPTTPKPSEGGETEEKSSNGWVYTVVTLVLLALVIILWRANTGLQRAANEKEGLKSVKEVPFWQNKVVIAIVCILVFIFTGYWITNGAVELGRQQNYQPEQPIFYSHKVHAGINQINCLYCHAGAEKGRHAMVPSTNVCMNCHKQISEYTGEAEHPLYTAEGKKVNGTAEIQKLYKYAGWDPAKKDYLRDAGGNILATPIKWTKIHNLPDHVYFNHSQHVKVGQVQCQRCHGAIHNMDEVYQSAPLSMGWCINCHRQTQVQFADNKYYSIFEKYHEEIKSGKRAGVTVEDIGGLECQKCHY